MKIISEKYTKYFGGEYMRYWYIAFAAVILWFTIGLVNNGAVSSYKVIVYDVDGKPLIEKEVKAASMMQPEKLPVSKSYEPIKPIKFLD